MNINSLCIACRFALLFIVALPPTLRSADVTKELPKLQGSRRILFLGDSITYSGQYVELIEVYHASRFPDQHLEFLNLGLPSETVSGLSEEGHAGGQFSRPNLHERLGRVLEKTRPDLVIVCYGMNDGIYLPFDEQRFEKFKDGIVLLRKKVSAAHAKIIHVTPPTFDEINGGHPGYGNALDRYSDWLLAQRTAGWDVVDLHRPMNRYLAEHRQKDHNFSLASDGVHCNETGHWIIAKQILLHLSAKDMSGVEDAQVMIAGTLHGEELLKLIQQRQRMTKDAWLTDVGHTRPGMNKGLPLAEAIARSEEIETKIRQLGAPLARPQR